MADAFGLELADLPSNFAPLRCVAVVVGLDDSGNETLSVRSSDMPPWDAAGLLLAALDKTRGRIMRGWETGTT